MGLLADDCIVAPLLLPMLAVLELMLLAPLPPPPQATYLKKFNIFFRYFTSAS